MRTRTVFLATAALGLVLLAAGCKNEAASGEQAKTEAKGAAKTDPSAYDALTPEQQAAVRALVRDTLISNPEIMDDVQLAYEARAQAAQQALVGEVAPKLASEHASLAIGPANARITVIQFFDYKCPFCHQSNAWTQNLVAARDDVRVIFKELPVLSENSTGAARAAIAAARQDKYWAFHNALMTARGDLNPAQVMQIAASVGLDIEKLQADMASDDVTAMLDGVRAQATSLGIGGTPAFVVNGQLINGWQPELVEAAIATAAPGSAAPGSAAPGGAAPGATPRGDQPAPAR